MDASHDHWLPVNQTGGVKARAFGGEALLERLRIGQWHGAEAGTFVQPGAIVFTNDLDDITLLAAAAETKPGLVVRRV